MSLIIDGPKVDDETLKKIDSEILEAEKLSEENGKAFHENLEYVQNKNVLTEGVEKLSKKEELLAKYLGVEPSEIHQGYNENVFEVGDVEFPEEYIVCDHDTAVELAKEDIINIYDDLGLEAFTPNFQEWILNNAIDDGYFYDAYEEIFLEYFNDMLDEDVADWLIDEGIVNVYDVYSEESEPWEPILRNDFDKEEWSEKYVQTKLSEIDNFVEQYKEDFGDLALVDLFKNGNIDVDLNKIVDECIKEDGIAHFIASYDGEQIDLGEGLYAYRVN